MMVRRRPMAMRPLWAASAPWLPCPLRWDPRTAVAASRVRTGGAVVEGVLGDDLERGDGDEARAVHERDHTSHRDSNPKPREAARTRRDVDLLNISRRHAVRRAEIVYFGHKLGGVPPRA